MVQAIVQNIRRAHPIKKIFLVLWGLAFVCGIGFSIFFLAQYGIEETLEKILGKGLSFWGVFFFLLLCVLRNILFFPLSLLFAISPVLFGLWPGIFIAGIGGILSSVVGFHLARYYGKDFITDTSSVKMFRVLNHKLENYGVISIVLLRIIPVFPGDVINFGAGLSKVRFRDFFWATSLAIWPDCLFYGFLGGSLSDPVSIIYTIAMGVFVVSILWYFKNHPEYKELFIMKIRKQFSKTRKKFQSFRKRKRKKRF